MANTVLTADVVAKEALRILDNNLVMSKLVYRGYESEWADKVNGYEKGATVSVRRPTDYTVRSGKTASVQDVVEGKFPLTVDTQEGVDFRFSSQDLTLKIEDLSERAIKPAMVQLANSIDRKLTALYKSVYNWVGTSTSVISSYAQFAKGPERLDLNGVPQDDRAAVLSPSDMWGFLPTQAGLYIQDVARDAFRRGEIGMVGNIDTYMDQNIVAHTRGTAQTGTVGADTSTTYASTLNSNTMTFVMQFAASRSINIGDVFTIAGVNAVNPVTKQDLGYAQQFVAVTAVGGTASVSFTITPPIITTGAFQTVTAAAASATTVTFFNNATGTYNSNLMFHKNAFALVVVPLVMPPGLPSGATRQSYKGMSARIIPYYTGADDDSNWRLDILYGVKCLDPRLATRINGN